MAADTPQPVLVKQLAETLERTPLSWRQARAADDVPDLESEARWLLVEWRTDGSIRYALSNLAATLSPTADTRSARPTAV